MAFWDKVTEVTKNVTDKTNDMLEIGRLNSKISAAQKNIDEKVLIIGDYFLNIFDKENEAVAELQTVYDEINVLREEIASLQAQVNELKGVPAEAAAAAVCPDCGAALPEGAKFCGSCGKKILAE